MAEHNRLTPGTQVAVSSDDERPVAVTMNPINIRHSALIVLAVIGTVFFIDWAQAVLLPLVASVLLSYALDPLVSALDRLRIPRPISAAVVLVSLLAVLALATMPLQREAMAMLDKIPTALDQFQRSATSEPSADESIMDKAQKAAKQIEETAKGQDADTESATSQATPVRIVEESFNVRNYLLTGSSAALVLVTQCFSVLLLVYFLLSIGSLYKRKVVRMSGPSFRRMRKAVRILNEFHRQVRRFIFVMLIGGVFVGVLTWFAFFMMGMEQAVLWGVVAGVASAVPYLGPFLVFVGTGAAAFLQFGAIDMAIIVAGVSLGITSIQGYLLTPWLTSQVSSLNAVAIFIGLLFWGWLWGAVGLIVATPLLMIIKSLCDHIENLQPVGELLGK
ncbi:AI-2E family transporter [Marinobacter caseinilyticus]|uniref:AI-2E family transporter n=1 Tax=Marinobacter caseinilyticus TaxID=2692195 RepID=UPI001A94E067|nr:AI-2E family transporter [Marinobacter caseinilyticus]